MLLPTSFILSQFDCLSNTNLALNNLTDNYTTTLESLAFLFNPNYKNSISTNNLLILRSAYTLSHTLVGLPDFRILYDFALIESWFYLEKYISSLISYSVLKSNFLSYKFNQTDYHITSIDEKVSDKIICSYYLRTGISITERIGERYEFNSILSKPYGLLSPDLCSCRYFQLNKKCVHTLILKFVLNHNLNLCNTR